MADFDLVVIGGGPGGYVAAIKAAQLGLHVAVVESRELGGTCLNRGCIPTKTLIHTSNLLDEVKASANCGLLVDNPRVDIPTLFARKDEVVSQLVGGVAQLFKANGVETYAGTGTITGEHTVRVTPNDGTDALVLQAKDILIATGSTPSRPPIPGLDLPGVITSDEALTTPADFKSIVIIGGGVIGAEIACVYASLGIHVTIVEMLDRIVATLDKEISQNLTMILKRRGLEIFTSARVNDLVKSDDGITVNFTYQDAPHSATADAVLAAMGRRPYTKDLLDGIELPMNRGLIVVDKDYRTAIPSIYAIGDVIGGITLAHKASAEGVCAAEVIAGKTPSTDFSAIPSCVYTSPEIASVGMTETEAKDAGHEVTIGKYSMMGNGKTIISQGARGFVKLIFDAKTDRIIGAQLMCERATDMISGLGTAISAGLTRQQLGDTIYPHPTFSEGIGEAVHAASGSAIHVAPARKR